MVDEVRCVRKKIAAKIQALQVLYRYRYRYRCRCRRRIKINGLMKKKGLALPSSTSSFALPLSCSWPSYPAPTSARSFLIFLLYPDLRFPKNCRLPWALFHFRNRGRGPDGHLRLHGKSHRRIPAFGLNTSSVAVDWSLCAGLCGSVALDWLLRVCCCRLVTVGWSLWVGRCRCCWSVSEGRSL